MLESKEADAKYAHALAAHPVGTDHLTYLEDAHRLHMTATNNDEYGHSDEDGPSTRTRSQRELLKSSLNVRIYLNITSHRNNWY